jgi:hypothetical protein
MALEHCEEKLPEETMTALKSGRTLTHKIVCPAILKFSNSRFFETSFAALRGLERKMNYCKSSVKLGICAATGKESHAISRRVVTHASALAVSVV